MRQTKANLLEVAEAVKVDAGVREHVVIPDAIMERAHSSPDERWLEAPVGDTPKALTILAHEAGHIATTRETELEYILTKLGALPHTPKELEATRWGFTAIRRNGGQTTEEMEDFARGALAGYASGDRQNGLPVSPEAQAFIAGNLDL